MISLGASALVWLSRSVLRYWLAWTWAGSGYVTLRLADAHASFVPAVTFVLAAPLFWSTLPFIAPGLALYLGLVGCLGRVRRPRLAAVALSPVSGVGVLFAPAPGGGRVYTSSFWLLGCCVVSVAHGLVIGVPRHRRSRRVDADPEEFAAAGWLIECALVFATGGLLLLFLPYALFVWP